MVLLREGDNALAALESFIEDGEEKDEQCLADALDAGRWLRGEMKEAPSKGWEPIVKRSLGILK
jgi:hypothetical protein